jgi:hypothetical protein
MCRSACRLPGGEERRGLRLLIQRNSISLKTGCGTVSIGADRASIFSQGTLALNWSYF